MDGLPATANILHDEGCPEHAHVSAGSGKKGPDNETVLMVASRDLGIFMREVQPERVARESVEIVVF